MKKHALLYGILGGAFIALLKFIEYRYLVVSYSLEIYGGLVALLFVTLGLWLGGKLTGTTARVAQEIPPRISAPFLPNDAQREHLGVTKRELEILELMAAGLSNREIAGRLFVSENTVKTHSSRLFEKLKARRRTQAVQIGQQLGLLP